MSVSRTFGDPEAKIPSYGGIPGAVIAIPDIKVFKIKDEYDFIVLGSDGIYDTMKNNDILQSVVKTVDKYKGKKSVHEICAASVECIVKNSLIRLTTDNVTVIMIAFKHFKNLVKGKITKDKTEENIKNYAISFNTWVTFLTIIVIIISY